MFLDAHKISIKTTQADDFILFLKISRLVDGKKSASCTSHTGAWVRDIVFGNNCNQLVTVGNNIQVSRLNILILNNMHVNKYYMFILSVLFARI